MIGRLLSIAGEVGVVRRDAFSYSGRATLDRIDAVVQPVRSGMPPQVI